MNLTASLEAVHREYLRRMTEGSGALLGQVEAYTVTHSGKMLRPRLTLMAAATLGEATLNSRRTLLAATCVEMIHNASLLHDDVIDNGSERRGQPTVNARWNNQVAVLVGDYHLAQVMRLLDEMNDTEAARMVNQTVTTMVEAELMALEDTAMSCERYVKIIDGKTAHLFSTACALGNPEYGEFGLHYGRLFQLHDDMADGESTIWTSDLIAEEKNTIDTIKHKLSIQI